MKYIIVYVTHPDMEHAKKIADELLHRKLIACVNYFPVSVSFHWEHHINSGNEVVTLLKTRKENWEILRLEVEKLHSYKIPCITKFEVEANSLYVDWIESVTHSHIS